MNAIKNRKIFPKIETWVGLKLTKIHSRTHPFFDNFNNLFYIFWILFIVFFKVNYDSKSNRDNNLDPRSLSLSVSLIQNETIFAISRIFRRKNKKSFSLASSSVLLSSILLTHSWSISFTAPSIFC